MDTGQKCQKVFVDFSCHVNRVYLVFLVLKNRDFKKLSVLDADTAELKVPLEDLQWKGFDIKTPGGKSQLLVVQP